ncbi:SsrA-binding protein SmpB [Aerococcus kribbianus]|uniref:SsrA-binding protein n=1 Tax=Aerococcus kribbianus TaxID=2999064 RepID=A0A9X3FU68_9LACT|nr:MULTISPECIES: SsrA-binding protein SmpB [unclassified Aerococcus]MCZ0716951.1 SsrA-binding protein SmpB [Aerococcus sp. YH-aer221]MCZ0725239.1 SsrA-binding protein SmpB [Aerococcus sp. YH-aer222]
MAKANKKDDNVVARNRKANHDFFIEDTIECGLVLKGTEIKSVRAGHINLKDGFARIERGEVWLYNVHISPFKEGNIFNHDPLRPRKLLLKRREINKLEKNVQQAGHTLVPLKVYIKHGVAKVLIGIARGKKQHDKRQAIKEKTMKREAQRAMKI